MATPPDMEPDMESIGEPVVESGVEPDVERCRLLTVRERRG